MLAVWTMMGQGSPGEKIVSHHGSTVRRIYSSRIMKASANDSISLDLKNIVVTTLNLPFGDDQYTSCRSSFIAN